MKIKNKRIVLASRPHGAPVKENFRIEDTQIDEIKDGQVLLKTVYLSLDPYMRGRMSNAPSYAEPVKIDEVMVGGTVSIVEESKNPDFNKGDWVLSQNGWQEYAVSHGKDLAKLGPKPENPSLNLGILGMPGFTGYMGLMEIGKPKEGETIVVAAATGPVGSTVGQVGKLMGCRVVGIAGGNDKCEYAKNELGFDECLDRNSKTFTREIIKACPDGIDIYFENVGGKVFDGVLPLLNTGARIPLCGLVSNYNITELPKGPDRLAAFMGKLLVKRITIKGFIIFEDYGDRFGEFLKIMGDWVKSGKIKYREDLVEGLENAPLAFMGLLEGENFGKLVVKVS